MPYQLRQATDADGDAVWELLQETIRWLRSTGSDQWNTWRTWGGPGGKIARAITGGNLWLLYDGPELAATITVEPDGDPDFWTDAELTEPALYVSKLAVRRAFAGREIGNLLLTWSRDLAARAGLAWVRLDAWRTNQKLHDYYRHRGWAFVRDVDQPHRSSGTLFQLPAALIPADLASQIEEKPRST